MLNFKKFKVFVKRTCAAEIVYDLVLLCFIVKEFIETIKAAFPGRPPLFMNGKAALRKARESVRWVSM